MSHSVFGSASFMIQIRSLVFSSKKFTCDWTITTCLPTSVEHSTCKCRVLAVIHKVPIVTASVRVFAFWGTKTSTNLLISLRLSETKEAGAQLKHGRPSGVARVVSWGGAKMTSDHIFPEISLNPLRCRFYCRFGLFSYTNLFIIGGRPPPLPPTGYATG